MPTLLPVPTKNPGDVLTSSLWNSYLRDNLNKLLALSHRTLTVAQFAALGTPEGTKGVVAGDEVYLEVDATNGILWHVVYESTDASAYKWRYLGGPPLAIEVLTAESPGSTGAYVDMATVGPSLTIPRLGDYTCTISAYLQTVTSPTKAALKIGAAATSDNECLQHVASASGEGASCAREIRRTFATNDVAKVQYSVGAITNLFSRRNLSVEPSRIG